MPPDKRGPQMGKHVERTNQTRQSIIDAFWDMAESEGAKNIRVSAIVKKAGINRSTFYEYFGSVEDLADHVEGIMIEELKQLIGDLYVRYNFSCSYRDLAKALAPYYSRLALLLGEDGDKRFLSRVQREAVALAAEITAEPDPMIEYELAYVVAAFAGVLTYWYDTGKKISEDAFTELFHTMTIKGLEAQCINADIQKQTGE